MQIQQTFKPSRHVAMVATKSADFVRGV